MPLRVFVLLMSLAMPVVAWLANREVFGPTNSEVSDNYPTLLIAAGYAFAIWGPIFLLDVAFGIWQLRRRTGEAVIRVRLLASVGFALTALWMPVFAMQVFWLALLIIWGALACLLACALILSNEIRQERGQLWLAWLPLSLHAGWLSLAVFLNTAQVIVAYGWLPTDDMLGWTLALFGLASVLLFALNQRMQGNLVYTAAALWGLVAVCVKQSSSERSGSATTACVAAALALALALQTLWLRLRRNVSSGAGEWKWVQPR